MTRVRPVGGLCRLLGLSESSVVWADCLHTSDGIRLLADGRDLAVRGLRRQELAKRICVDAPRSFWTPNRDRAVADWDAFIATVVVAG